MMKRTISLLMSIVMVVTMLPLQAMATEVSAEETLAPVESFAVLETTAVTETTAPAATVLETTVPEQEETQPPETTEPAVSQTVTEVAEAVVSEATGFSYTVLNGTYCEVTGYTGTETAITIPSEIDGYIVQSIGNNAFKGNKTLTAVAFPETLESMGTYVFSGCTSLTDVRLNEGLKKVGDYTFQNCTSLETFTLPGSVTTLGEGAFTGCTALTAPGLHEGLLTISHYAFKGCTSLEEVVLPDRIQTPGYESFANCTNLSNINYPLSLANSPDRYTGSSHYYGRVFYGCSSLKKIEIPEGVTAIPAHMFRECNYLEEVTFPSTLQTIGVYAFDGCTNLRIVEFNEGLTAIPDYAFRNCSNLAVVDIPSSVTAIGSYAFYNCLGLRIVNLGSGVKSIGKYAFYGCDGLLSLVLNDGLTTISENAFGDCANLQSVEIPSSVTSINTNSFRDCGKLTVYCYSGSQAHIVGESAGLDLYILDAHEHAFQANVETEAECTRDGSQIMICSICNYYYIEILEALGHTAGEWTTLNKPSCTAEGIRVQNCTVCGDETARDYIPAYGHMESDWAVTEGDCETGGYKVKHCTICDAEVEREKIPANGHSWSQWIVESMPSVLCEGVSYRACSVCQKREEIIQEKLNVDYTTNANYGLVHLTVVDATNLEPVSGASVFVSTEKDGEATLFTDSQGKISQILPVGTLSLSVFADGYQTRSVPITVEPGENVIPQIGISTGYLVEGQLTAEEMTLEEMIAAGIDVNDPSNQHLYKYALVLEFVPEIDWLSILFYMGGDGLPYVTGAYVPGGPTGPSGPGDGDGDGGGGSNGPWSIIRDGGGNGGGRGVGIRYTLMDGQVVSVYPVNERFYLIIYGEVHWVKEMYHVELLTINHSMTDTVENAEAVLTLPAGLSLAKMVGEQQTLKQEIGSLASGESKSVHWYVRGDAEGTYSISATLRGHMLPFGDAFEYTYEAKDPIKVYAGSAMHLTFHVPDSAFTGEPYTVRIELENVSDKTLYNVTHAITDVDQFRVTEYSDGMKEIEEYPVSGGTGSIFIPEFRPGDVIVIETTTIIMFESKLIEYQKEQAKELLSAVEGLMQGFKAFETGVSLIGTMTDWLGNATSAIDDYLDNIVITAAEKAKLAASLGKQFAELAQEFSGDPTAGMAQKIQELKAAGVWDEVQAFIDDPSVLETYSARDLAKLACKISAAKAPEPEKFDPYDAVRNLIDMIPVRFRLVDAWVATLEGSTTVIPSSINVIPVGPHYFGVENVSRYISTLLKLYMADVVADAMPIEILGDKFKEDIGYADDLEYVRTVENQASEYRITGTGGAGFRAWIERADSAAYRFAADGAQEPDFELSVDNGTGVLDENGVLSFTGSGTLSVTPRSQVPGVLCVEMEDGSIKRYTLEVVEEHTCGSEDWTVIYGPSDEMDGLKVKYCDVCEEIVDMAAMASCSDHEFGESVLVLEPTLDAAGKEVRTCIHCGAQEYNYTDALSIGSYVDITSDKEALTAGESASLTAQILPGSMFETEILWSLAEGCEQFAVLKVKDDAVTLTAGNVKEKQEVTVIARADDGLTAAGTLTIPIYPKTESVRILSSGKDVTGGTIPFNLNGDTDTLTLTAEAVPGDAKQTFLWSSSDEKIAAVEDGIVTFTGTDGKVKITATAQDGTGKSATVTIQTVRVPHNLEKEDEVEGDADIAILGGKSRNLVVTDKDTGKALTAKQITWSLPEEYAAFSSVSAKGKLSTKKVVTLTRIEVLGAITDSTDDPVTYVIDIYPAVTHVEILDDGNVVNGQTLNMVGDTLTLNVSTYPYDAMQGINWTNPDAKKQAYAQYSEDETGNLTISNPTGKAGTLTLKATANDGSKKSATVKIQFGVFAESLTIQEPEILSLRSGGTMTLKAEVSPAKVTKSGIVWSLADSADSAYVTVSNGKVKAKTVTENHYVTIRAVSKNTAASDSITILVMPKSEEQLILKSGEEYLTGRTKAMDSSTGTAQLQLSAFTLVTPTYGQFGENSESVTWTSSKPQVAAISAQTGDTVTVTLLKSGTSVITAESNDGRKATVTVKGSVLVDTLRITAKETQNLTENGIEVASGKAVTLLAQVNENASAKKVTWSILSGGEYATISASGKLTAAKNLTSAKSVVVQAIAADGSGKRAEVTVTLRPIAQGLQVYTIENGVQTFTARSSRNLWVRNSTTAQWDLTTQGSVISLNADVYPFYETNEALNAMQRLSWKSSSSKVADFLRDENGALILDEDGNVQLLCHRTGKTTITVTAEDGSKQKVSFNLNIVQNVDDLDLAPQVLASGKSLNLAKLLQVYPEGTTTKKFSWSITGGDGADYATLSSSGSLKAKTVTGHKQVEVTVTAQDVLAYSETFVIDLYPATTKVQIFCGGEDVTGGTLTLAAGESLQLTASSQPESAADSYTWKSAKPGNVAVDEDGTITVLGGSGTVTITCTAADGTGKKATVKVKIG